MDGSTLIEVVSLNGIVLYNLDRCWFSRLLVIFNTKRKLVRDLIS